MNRLEQVREIVDGILHGLENPENKRCGFIHLYGVSLTAMFLADRRGIDPELPGVAGMLHDLASYETGDPADHAQRSGERAAGILRELGTFASAEIDTVQSAIAHHSDKAGVHGPIDELMKDADVLQHHYYNPGLPPHPKDSERLARLKETLLRNAFDAQSR